MAHEVTLRGENGYEFLLDLGKNPHMQARIDSGELTVIKPKHGSAAKAGHEPEHKED